MNSVPAIAALEIVLAYDTYSIYSKGHCYHWPILLKTRYMEALLVTYDY